MKVFPMLLAIASTVSAVSSCDPTKSSNCPADPGLGGLFREDFALSAGDHLKVLDKPGKVLFDLTNGMLLTMEKRGDNPTVQLNFYIMFGKVEVVLKAAKGKGVISSFYLQSDDLDEIDIELFGGDNYEFQSNYFVKGNTKTYDRGAYHPTLSSPLDNFHTYTIEWNPDALTWSLDGNVVRTLTKDNPQGYPQSPMQLIAGVWAGGDPDNQQGTIEWAGGVTDFSQVPFTMDIKLLIVSDYSLGTQYSYLDQLGSWSSIKSNKGTVNDRELQANSEFSQLQSGGAVNSPPQPSSSDASSSDTSDSSTQQQSTSSSLSLVDSITQISLDSLSSLSSLSLESSLASSVFIVTGQDSQSSNLDSTTLTSSSLTSQDSSLSVVELNGLGLFESSKGPDLGLGLGLATGLVDPNQYVTPGYAGQQGAQTQGQIQTLTTLDSRSTSAAGLASLTQNTPLGSTAHLVSLSNIGSYVSTSFFSILVFVASHLLV